MAEGGEERAVFIGLKNDAQEALPKIAEKNAELVDTTAEKGAAALAAHAATEADVTSDLESRMPADVPPITADATQNVVATSAAASAGVAEAESAQAAVAAEETVKGTPLQEALTPDDGEAVDAATPEFGNDTLRELPNYNDEIDQSLREQGLGVTRDEYDRLRLTPTNDLSPEDLQKVASIRNTIKIGDGQIVSKVVGKNIAEGYLKNDVNLFGENTFDPKSFGNSIARGVDTADLTTPADLRRGLALDDGGEGWSPVPDEPDAVAYQMRFPAPEGLGADSRISYGHVGDPNDASLKATGDQVARDATGNPAATGAVMKDPYTGTGYTKGGVPEWLAPRGTQLPSRAEMWKITPDGQETMIGYYAGESWNQVGDL